MGEVYRARDPQLGRDVAIKILLSFLSRDPERLRRFEQEARAAAALNHPNILAVDDAKAAADKALAFARQTVDRSSNFAASMAVAEVNIRRGKIKEATQGLESVRAEAARHGYRDFEFQARLKLGEIMLRSIDAANGRAQLRQLQSDALNKGFVRIAHQAQAALAS